MANDPALGWQGDLLNLDAYLTRIGFAGDPAPTARTLRAVQRGHVTSIPFENLEIMLDRPIVFGIDNLQRKLVLDRRGGYCFEQTALFAAALERLGFAFTALVGRVTMGSDKLRPTTHALLLVEADGDQWICDVGFGRGPLEPILFADGNEVVQDGWGFRLEKRTDAKSGMPGVQEWALVQHGPDGWTERHTFQLAPVYRLDFEVLSHYVSTHPRSPFTTRPFAQRFTVEAHYQLDGTSLTTTRPNGKSDMRVVGLTEVPPLLDETFGITLAPADAARLTDDLSDDR